LFQYPFGSVSAQACAAKFVLVVPPSLLHTVGIVLAYVGMKSTKALYCLPYAAITPVLHTIYGTLSHDWDDGHTRLLVGVAVILLGLIGLTRESNAALGQSLIPIPRDHGSIAMLSAGCIWAMTDYLDSSAPVAGLWSGQAYLFEMTVLVCFFTIILLLVTNADTPWRNLFTINVMLGRTTVMAHESPFLPKKFLDNSLDSSHSSGVTDLDKSHPSIKLQTMWSKWNKTPRILGLYAIIQMLTVWVGDVVVKGEVDLPLHPSHTLGLMLFLRRSSPILGAAIFDVASVKWGRQGKRRASMRFGSFRDHETITWAVGLWSFTVIIGFALLYL
jgi:hypothetical protein